VTASQHGQPIFMLTCSFTLPTPARFPQPSFREPMPLGIPPPMECQSEEERWSKFLASPRAAKLQPSSRHSLEAYVLERESSPVAIREVPRNVEFWFEDDDASEEKRRADKVEAKWDGSVAGKVNFAARARVSDDPNSAGQSINQVKRKMERHERMLWMKAKDENVANLDNNFQKVCVLRNLHTLSCAHDRTYNLAEYPGLFV
jgi:acyl-CoA thioesterase